MTRCTQNLLLHSPQFLRFFLTIFFSSLPSCVPFYLMSETKNPPSPLPLTPTPFLFLLSSPENCSAYICKSGSFPEGVVRTRVDIARRRDVGVSKVWESFSETSRPRLYPPPPQWLFSSLAWCLEIKARWMARSASWCWEPARTWGFCSPLLAERSGVGRRARRPALQNRLYCCQVDRSETARSDSADKSSGDGLISDIGGGPGFAPLTLDSRGHRTCRSSPPLS
jgi:hypothetical protein